MEMATGDANFLGELSVLRSKCYRILCQALGEDFQGLAIAARRARGSGLIGNALCKKLVNLDTAFAISRHLNSVKGDLMLEELCNAVAGRRPPLAAASSCSACPKEVHLADHLPGGSSASVPVVALDAEDHDISNVYRSDWLPVALAPLTAPTSQSPPPPLGQWLSLPGATWASIYDKFSRGNSDVPSPRQDWTGQWLALPDAAWKSIYGKFPRPGPGVPSPRQAQIDSLLEGWRAELEELDDMRREYHQLAASLESRMRKLSGVPPSLKDQLNQIRMFLRSLDDKRLEVSARQASWCRILAEMADPLPVPAPGGALPLAATLTEKIGQHQRVSSPRPTTKRARPFHKTAKATNRR